MRTRGRGSKNPKIFEAVIQRRILPFMIRVCTARGVVALSVLSRTLIHEAVGSNLAVVTLSVLPQGWVVGLHT